MPAVLTAELKAYLSLYTVSFQVTEAKFVQLHKAFAPIEEVLSGSVKAVSASH